MTDVPSKGLFILSAL
uniref:Uncharacterized protein n=1 Tax=Anguilla anguilla TaxID=7936 RepID=A0A0E9V946_ANGAN